MTLNLQGAGLVVHLYVDARGWDQRADRDFLYQVWQRLGTQRALTASVAGLPTDPSLDGGTGLLAARRYPGSATPHVEEALLRREQDVFCMSIMREPAGATWEDLEREWAEMTRGLGPPPGLIGTAHLFLARLPRPAWLARMIHRTRPDPVTLSPTVRYLLPDPPATPGGATMAVRWLPGVSVSHGFAVWEASEAADERSSRRIVVVAAENADDRLSAWTWVVGPERELPELGRYLLHAAKLRYELRVWRAEHPAFRKVRDSADATVDELLDLLAARKPRPASARLLDAARRITMLQAQEPGLVRTHTALTEMRRTADIATANLTALSDPDAGGMFADDRTLGAWFGRQLDDDAVYLGATRERAGQVAALTDQLLQRQAQDERERFNLACTGAIGAILMVLAASQAFAYKPPLSYLLQPAVVALLGALALLSTLLMLWIVARGRWWARVLLWVGWGLVGATTAWVTTSAVLAATASENTTRWWAIVGFAGACALAVLSSAVTTARQRRASRP